MSYSKQLVKFSELANDFEYVRETTAAYLFRFDADTVELDTPNGELWIPKSVCQYDLEDGVLEVERWWAERNDLA